MADKWVKLSDKERERLLYVLSPDSKIDIKISKKINKVSKSIKISSRKGKGRGLQMWVCKKISKLINIPFDNQNDECLIHCREMGQSGEDIILRDIARGLFPFAIECKSTEQINLKSFIDQAKSNCSEGNKREFNSNREYISRDWMVVIKTKSIPEHLVVISWDTFEKVFKKIIKE